MASSFPDLSSLQFPSLDKAMSEFERTNPDYNNPGGLMYGDFTISHGSIGSAPSGLAKFPDSYTGFAAQDALIGYYANQKGYSLSQMINKWSPPDAAGNSKASTTNYIKSIAEKLGLNPDAPLSGSKSEITDAQVIEGMKKASSGLSMGILPGLGSETISRYVAIVLGLVCIAGGILLFKPVRETVVTTAKTAVKTAAIAS